MTTLAAYAAFLTARWDEIEGLDDECSCSYPAYVLADLAAKRAVLALHTPRVFFHPGGSQGVCNGCHGGWPCPTLAHLAEPFRDHPTTRRTGA